jgi:hypothetical protein
MEHKKLLPGKNLFHWDFILTLTLPIKATGGEAQGDVQLLSHLPEALSTNALLYYYTT